MPLMLLFDSWLLPFRLLSLAILVVFGMTLVLPHGKQQERKLLRFAVAFLALLLLGEPAFRSWTQYQTWANDPAAQFLLPPYQPWTYFAGYAFRHFMFWRLLGGVVAVTLYALAQRFIVFPSEGFRMNRAENALLAFGIAFASWPYFLVYLASFLLLYTLILVFFQLRRSGEERRFPVALPATMALLVIPFANSLIVILDLTVLRVTNLSI